MRRRKRRNRFEGVEFLGRGVFDLNFPNNPVLVPAITPFMLSNEDDAFQLRGIGGITTSTRKIVSNTSTTNPMQSGENIISFYQYYVISDSRTFVSDQYHPPCKRKKCERSN